jgi:hypothetical protein
MKKIDFRELQWPRAMNRYLLQGLLTAQTFKRLIFAFLDKSRREKRIILPSRKCAKMCLAYAYGKLVA